MAELPAVWFHGSPAELTELRVESAVTPERALAEAFSHKPTLVSTDAAGTIRHNGRADGYLYRVAEPVHADDVAHGQGPEWHTRRHLRVVLVGPTRLAAEALLSPDDEAVLRQRVGAYQSAD